jgi:predicted RNA-binding protein Jag
MKSIVEEASSIKQAIENGWKRLGEPTVFSVKILERPETGFFGFNTKSAKIALIVEEKSAPSQIRQQFRDEQPKHKNAPAKQSHKKEHSSAKNEHARDLNREHNRDHARDFARDNGRDYKDNGRDHSSRDNNSNNTDDSAAKWSDDRIALVRTWLKELLHLMKKDDVTFDTHVTDATLHIKFTSPFLHDSKQERFVFASISHLMMETLRNKSKKILRNMRINISGQ